MASIERSAHVPYGAGEMLALVNDIDAYPDFLHWCHAARIERDVGSSVDAALEIGISSIYKTIRTRNTTIPATADSPATIRIEMIEGPLKHLQGIWEFADRPGDGCDVKLEIEFEVHRSPLGLILRALFDEIANSQLHAFVKRADAVYGRG